jgi:hypothetical protein
VRRRGGEEIELYVDHGRRRKREQVVHVYLNAGPFLKAVRDWKKKKKKKKKRKKEAHYCSYL